LCGCPFEDRIPEKKIQFLTDQRTERQMIITIQKDQAHNMRVKTAFEKLKRRNNSEMEQSTSVVGASAIEKTYVMSIRLRTSNQDH